jgi:hypothetical protein
VHLMRNFILCCLLFFVSLVPAFSIAASDEFVGNHVEFTGSPSAKIQCGVLLGKSLLVEKNRTLKTFGLIAKEAFPNLTEIALYRESGTKLELVSFGSLSNLVVGRNEMPAKKEVGLVAGTYWLLQVHACPGEVFVGGKESSAISDAKYVSYSPTGSPPQNIHSPGTYSNKGIWNTYIVVYDRPVPTPTPAPGPTPAPTPEYDDEF